MQYQTLGDWCKWLETQHPINIMGIPREGDLNGGLDSAIL